VSLDAPVSQRGRRKRCALVSLAEEGDLSHEIFDEDGIVMGPAPVRLSPRKLARGLIAKRAVRTTLVIFDTPAYQDNARFVQIAEEFAVQAFIRSLS
jgi:hypothetical protein